MDRDGFTLERKFIRRLKYLPAIFSLDVMVFFALPTLSASEGSTDPAHRSRQYSKIKKDDALSCPSRVRHLSKEFAWTLRKQFSLPLDEEQNVSEKKEAKALAEELIEILSEFVVSNSDLILLHLSSAKLHKTTHREIYREVSCLALEQIFSMALSLGCIDELVKQLEEGREGIVLIKLRDKLETTTHISTIIEESEEPKRKFSERHAELMSNEIYLITSSYKKLFNWNGREIIPLSSEVIALINETRKCVSKSLLPSTLLDSFLYTLATFIVVESNRIAETSPEKFIFDIYTSTVYTALQNILPMVSVSGLTWGFANSLKNNKSKSKISKKLKSLFQEKAPHILNNRGAVEEKRYIKNQMHDIHAKLHEVVKEYFSVFHKRKTFGSIPSPL
ncbi:MAG: hypothetical protein LBI77_01235 [Puniceicoccales bacterium]|jgi:hypothetical protein|nr:hypothetical protein [Puniceicoccales bacterium]